MPRLPSSADLGPLRNASSGRPIATTDTTAVGEGMQSFGKSLGKAADDLHAIVEKQRKEQTTLETARAMGQLNIDRMEADTQFQPDRDQQPATWGERHNQIITEKSQAALSVITDPRQRELVSARIMDDVKRDNLVVQERAKTIIRDERRAVFERDADTFVDRAFSPGTLMQDRERLLAERRIMVGAARDNGVVTPAEAIRIEEKGKARAADLEANELVQRDPEGARRAFRSGVVATPTAPNPAFAPVVAEGRSVDMGKVEQRVRDGLAIAGEIYGAPLRVTYGVEGRHAPGSQHYSGTAVDLRTRDLSPTQKGKLAESLVRAGFTGIHEDANHLHADMRPGNIWRGHVVTPEVSASLDNLRFMNGAKPEGVDRFAGAVASPRLAALSPERRAYWAAQADQQSRKIMVAQEAERAAAVDQIQFRASSGEYSVADAQRDWQAGNVFRRFEEFNSVVKLAEKYEADEGAFRSTVAKMGGDGVFNPLSKADRDGLEVVDERSGLITGLTQASPEAQTRAVQQFARTGMVSQTQKGLLEGMIRSGNPQQLDYAMSTLDLMNRRNANAFASAFSNDTFKTLQLWQTSVDRNPTVFRDKLKEAADPATMKAREELEKKGRKIVADMPDEKIVELFDDSWRYNPKAPITTRNFPGMGMLRGEYADAFAEGFSVHGSETKAKEFADARIKSTWAWSNASNGRVMKYAPELVLPRVGDDHAWMVEQVKADMKARGIPASDFALVPTPETKAEIDTLRERGKTRDDRSSPRWRLIYEDASGVQRDGGWYSFDLDKARQAHDARLLDKDSFMRESAKAADKFRSDRLKSRDIYNPGAR